VGILTQIQAAKGDAVLHKIEGDLGSARYWYRPAGKLDHVSLSRQSETAADDEPQAE
jgi:hypothetical protein